MNRYKCEKKNFFLRKKFFRGGPAHPVKKNFSGLRPEKFFFGYTWIHLAIARCCRIHLKGLKSVPGYGFWAQVYPEVFRWGVIAKKKFQGGAGYPWHNPTCTYACFSFFLNNQKLGMDSPRLAPPPPLKFLLIICM